MLYLKKTDGWVSVFATEFIQQTSGVIDKMCFAGYAENPLEGFETCKSMDNLTIRLFNLKAWQKRLFLVSIDFAIISFSMLAIRLALKAVLSQTIRLFIFYA